MNPTNHFSKMNIRIIVVAALLLVAFSTTLAEGSPNLDSSRAIDLDSSRENCCAKNLVPLYRLYRAANDLHFYTTSAFEADNAVAKLGFTRHPSPGLVANATTDCPCNKAGLTPVYRLYKAGPKEMHFYTADANEADNAATKLGYTRVGIAYYCAPSAGQCGSSVPLLRYWLGATGHFYTNDANEGKIIVIPNGGRLVGTTCYIWPAGYKHENCRRG